MVNCDFGSMTDDVGETRVGRRLGQGVRWSTSGKYFWFFVCFLNGGTGFVAKDVGGILGVVRIGLFRGDRQRGGFDGGFMWDVVVWEGDPSARRERFRLGGTIVDEATYEPTIVRDLVGG